MIDKIVNLIKTNFCRFVFNYEIDNNKWIFSSTDNMKFNYNSKYMFEYVIKNEPNIKPYYVINDDIERKKLQSKYGERYFIDTKTIKGILTILSSGVWFTSAGLPLYGLKLNRRRIIVNLWHGVPLKKIALMENNYGFIKKSYFKSIFSNNYTYLVTTSERLIPIMRDSFGVPEEKIKIWGQPRNDVLFEPKIKNLIDLLYKDLPNYNKVILYAPTYRDCYETNIFPFNDYNLEEMNEFLEDNELIIFLRMHISEKANISNYLSDRVRLLDESIVSDIMEILNLFDILISDYSSIYIDYLLLDRPIIFLPYDKEEYLKQRGMNFEYNNVTPGYKPESMKEFFSVLETILEGKDEFKDDRGIVNQIFNKINRPCAQIICSQIKNEIDI